MNGLRTRARRALPPPGPIRPLALATLVTTVGSGLWYAGWAIFFTRSVGLSAEQVGIGITTAGLLGLVVATPVGRIADRLGPRDVLVALTAIQGVAMTAYVVVDDFWSFLVVACIATMAERSFLGVRMALVTGLIGDGDEPDVVETPTSANAGADAHTTTPAAAGVGGVRALQRARLDALAYLRVVNHVGFAIGAALAAIVVQVDTRAAYVAMVLLNAATFFGYSIIVAGMPRVRPAAATGRDPRMAVLRDAPYVVVSVLSGILALCWGMLSSGVPLWITHHTDAPRWAAAAIVFLNAAGIALFQRRFSRTSDEPQAAARTSLRAACLLAASCVLFALTYHGAGVVAVAVLLVAGVVHVIGELLYAASSWGLSIGLMPEHAHGEYQGMFATGTAAAQMLAPALMTFLVVEIGLSGWFILGALFLGAGVPTIPATRWALRTRPGDRSGNELREATA